MARISAVVFDMYGTLTPSWPRDVWDEQKRACAAPLGLTESVWLAALDASWDERLTGVLGSITETFRTVATRAGNAPSDEQLAAAVALRYAGYRKVHELRPDALDVLGALRADGYKIALVSDCTPELADQWDVLGLADFFDATVFSCNEGTRKPDPVLFHAAAERLGVQPDECLYVGDGGGDELAGSAGVGMHPVLLAGADWTAHHAPGRPTAEWTGHRAETLSEIPAILAGYRID
ncbi:MAG TPA: HAD family hydrolase [Actinospica sp.]|jgi:putative hydrolase of the HAD superfamily|nr:HAD family hydrolase [Actinospica sp.]